LCGELQGIVTTQDEVCQNIVAKME